MKRTWITMGLCAGLVMMPMDQPKAQMAAAFCLAIIVVVAGGTAVVVINHCSPKYAIVSGTADNPRTNCWCQIAPRSVDLDLNEIRVVSPVRYSSLSKCNDDITKYCDVGVKLVGLSTDDEPATDPTIHIEKSTDQKHWFEVGTWTGPLELLNWSETNQLASACFYRAWY